MQNWESMPQANYDHNWYGNMFSSVKREPITSPYSMENQYLNMQKSTSAMDTNYGSPVSPSSHQQTEGVEGHNFYGVTNNNHPLGFNPLTPPGYPNPIIPQINFNQESSFAESSSTTSSAATVQNAQVPHKDQNIKPHTDVSHSLTPSHTPPMDITPPKSPKSLPGTPEKDNEVSSNSNDSGEDMRYLESDNDDESISKPKFNSHGKVKKFKCKQCGYIAITKVDFWAHAREHIKPEKLLECHFCPFVTELKHHLEYHIRKHKNLKPFQCDQCSYSCVNKSMLNSHLKSHSKVYQYRCADCDYATKYCHSFKLHLRKYTHKPGMVLNEDGTPNPLIIIDVYGTRRGPKMKGRDNSAGSKTAKQEARNMGQKMQSSLKSSDLIAAQPRIPPILNNQSPNLVGNLLPSTLANMLQQSRNLPFFPYLNLNLQMLAAQQQAVLAQLSPNIASEQSANNNEDNEDNEDTTSKYDSEPEEPCDVVEQNNHLAMDLTQTSPIKSFSSFSGYGDRKPNLSTDSNKGADSSPIRGDRITATPVLSTSKINRRKGRAFRFDASGIEAETEEPYDEPAKLVLENFPDEMRPVDPQTDADKCEEMEADVRSRSAKDLTNNCHPTQSNASGDDPNLRLTPRNTYECKSCGIFFRDAVLHTIHMGYHSCDDEFKCNMCGEKCGDRLTFFVHIARFPHS